MESCGIPYFTIKLNYSDKLNKCWRLHKCAEIWRSLRITKIKVQGARQGPLFVEGEDSNRSERRIRFLVAA